MQILAAAHGTYPRIGESPGQQRLWRGQGRLDRGEITKADFEALIVETIGEAISEQEKAGLDLVTDGMVRWHDPVSHLARGFEGVEINGILRFFDTNTYYRQPVIKGKLRPKPTGVAEEIRYARSRTGKPVKAVLTGPYTLAALSRVEAGYADRKSLVLDLAEGIAGEVSACARAGASWIQIEEPAILKNPREFPILRAGIERLAAARDGARLALATYFGDAAPLVGEFESLPVDLVVYDLAYGTKVADRLRAVGTKKGLGLGIVDGRNTKVEDAAAAARRASEIAKGAKASEVHVTTSCGLEYLPRDRAFEKLTLLARIKGMCAKG